MSFSSAVLVGPLAIVIDPASINPVASAAVTDKLFAVVPTVNCVFSHQAQDALCLHRVQSFLDASSPVRPPRLSAAQVRCEPPGMLPDGSPIGTGRCAMRPNVVRTNQYPEGVELIFSDNAGDAGRQFLDTADALLVAAPPHMPPGTVVGPLCGLDRPPVAIDTATGRFMATGDVSVVSTTE